MENYTYMTLLTNNTYVQGVILLNETLKKVKSKYPLIVLVTNEVAQATLDILDYLEIKWKLVDIIKFNDTLQTFANQQLNSHIIIPYNILTKLQIYYQYEYDKICYLDSDIMILRNIDFLFKKYNDFTCTKNFQYQADLPKIIFKDKKGNIKRFKNKNIYDNDRINCGFLLFSPKKEKIQIIDFLSQLNINDFPKVNNNDYIENDELLLKIYLTKYPRNKINYLNRYFNTVYFSDMPFEIFKDINNNSFFIHFVGIYKPWDLTNSLFSNKNLPITQYPNIVKYNFVDKAIKIIQQVLFSLPPNLMLNFSKAYIKEIQSN